VRLLLNWFLPGSILFLTFALAAGVALLFARGRLRQIGRVWLALLALFYLSACTRLGMQLLLAPLYHRAPVLADAAAAQGADGVVVLNAGANTYQARGQQMIGIHEVAALRLLEAARVYRMLGNPIVIVQGGFPELTDRPSIGSVYAKALADLGVPADRIIVEPNSHNTREHAENLRPYLQKHNVHRFVLVTSPEHMWRSSITFRAAGYDFVPSAARAKSELDEGRHSALHPSGEHLDRVVWGMHEYVGILYYWVHGWL
jgi:uncharacterized SAM-binding protein YcdF (DUF218 family)